MPGRSATGRCPPGLTLNASTGLLGGNPAASGGFSFIVRVVDASGQNDTKSLNLVIAAAPTITFAPAAGEVGIAYSQQPTLTGGTAAIVWAITAGSLPPGTTFSTSTGLISGIPTTAGNFAVTITATDSFNQIASSTTTLVIVALPSLTFTSPADGQVGVPYSATLSVTGGTLPLAWSVTAGSPPPGLTLNSATGVLSGTPTTVGSSPVTVRVVDFYHQATTRAVTFVVGAGPLVIVKTANASSVVPGSPVAYTITVTNTGSSAVTGVTFSNALTDVLDDAVYNSDATATAGAVTYSSSTVGWTGNLLAGASVTIGYSITVNNPDIGNKVLANTVTSTTLGTNCSITSIDTRCTASVSVTGLTIVKTADVATTTPGGTVRFSIMRNSWFDRHCSR